MEESIEDIIQRTGGYPIHVSHRGSSVIENTIYSFRRAVQHGARILEIDLRRTKDDHLILMHDSTVDRTTNGYGAIDAYLLEEIIELDAAYNDPEMRGKGITVATFKEFLDEFVPVKDLLFFF